MTMQEKLIKNNKAGLLQLARELGNVSRARKIFTEYALCVTLLGVKKYIEHFLLLEHLAL